MSNTMTYKGCYTGTHPRVKLRSAGWVKLRSARTVQAGQRPVEPRRPARLLGPLVQADSTARGRCESGGVDGWSDAQHHLADGRLCGEIRNWAEAAI